MARFRLVLQRLQMKVPLAEFGHNFCPVIRRGCPCMQGWKR
jgi:hypothetical protein